MKVFCLLLLLAALVNAVEYNYGPTNNWKTLIASGLKPGDILNLAAGTYTLSGRWGVSLNGEVNNPIIIRRAPSATGAVDFVRTDVQNVIDISNSGNFKMENLHFSVGSGCSDGCRGIRLGTGNVWNAVFDGITIAKPSSNGFSANDAGAKYWNITLKNSIVRETIGTGECVYVGCNGDACQFYDSLIDRNYCFNTLGTTKSDVGSGIQVKSGSYNNVISNNIVYKTKGVGILLYDDYGRGRNTIDSNLIIEAGNHGIQASAGVIIKNNIVVSATLSCIGLIENQLQPDTKIRNIDIIHNTVTGAAEACLRINGDRGAPININVANNAFFCNGKRVTQGAGVLATSVNYVKNFGAGSNAPTSGFTAAVITDALVNPTASGINFYPKTGSVLIGAGSSDYTAGYDYNGLARSTSSVTVGAYQYSSASNPIIPSNSGLKQFPSGGVTPTTPPSVSTTSSSSKSSTSSTSEKVSTTTSAKSSTTTTSASTTTTSVKSSTTTTSVKPSTSTTSVKTSTTTGATSLAPSNDTPTTFDSSSTTTGDLSSSTTSQSSDNNLPASDTSSGVCNLATLGSVVACFLLYLL